MCVFLPVLFLINTFANGALVVSLILQTHRIGRAALVRVLVTQWAGHPLGARMVVHLNPVNLELTELYFPLVVNHNVYYSRTSIKRSPLGLC